MDNISGPQIKNSEDADTRKGFVFDILKYNEQ